MSELFIGETLDSVAVAHLPTVSGRRQSCHSIDLLGNNGQVQGKAELVIWAVTQSRGSFWRSKPPAFCQASKRCFAAPKLIFIATPTAYLGTIEKTEKIVR